MALFAVQQLQDKLNQCKNRPRCYRKTLGTLEALLMLIHAAFDDGDAPGVAVTQQGGHLIF